MEGRRIAQKKLGNNKGIIREKKENIMGLREKNDEDVNLSFQRGLMSPQET